MAMSRFCGGTTIFNFGYGAFSGGKKVPGTVVREGTGGPYLVVLMTEALQYVDSTYADSSGAFEFSGLLPGKYTCVALDTISSVPKNAHIIDGFQAE
jgi:hypothetical protein